MGTKILDWMIKKLPFNGGAWMIRTFGKTIKVSGGEYGMFKMKQLGNWYINL